MRGTFKIDFWILFHVDLDACFFLGQCSQKINREFLASAALPFLDLGAAMLFGLHYQVVIGGRVLFTFLFSFLSMGALGPR